MEFPTLDTSRLRLTQLSAEDVSSLFTVFSDENVVKYYDTDVYQSEEQAAKLIEFFNGRFAEMRVSVGVFD